MTMRRTPAIVIGLIAGIIWAIAQFVLSEGLYRVATMIDTASDYEADTEAFYRASDLIAWPAGDIYDAHYNALMEKSLIEVADGVEDPEIQAEAKRLLVAIRENPVGPEDDPYLDAEDFLFEMDIYVALPYAEEYTIYIGTCAVWGLIVGSVVSLLVVVVRSNESRPRGGQGRPPVINTLG